MRSSPPGILDSRWRRLVPRSVAILLLIGVLAVSCAPTIHTRGAVEILTANSEVNQVMRQYIDRGISAAEKADAKAVVIRLDTPGGLSTEMQKIVERIQTSKVPVIVYVAPSGAQAASAGTFITMSAQVAAMAPATTIGAAHPVSATGGDITGTLGTKVTNNAAAYARSIADKTGRNADWAEAAVRQSVSATTNEAVAQHIVDYSATSIDDLLRKADGRTVNVNGTSVTLSNLESAPRVTNNMTFTDHLLLLLSDPNVAFVLLAIGGVGLLIEFIHPGFIAPGMFGVIALILAFFSLGTLPVNWAGVALILLAFVFFAAELHFGGFGAAGLAGVISLVTGGLLLTSTSNPNFQVSRWLIAGMGVACAIFFFTVIRALIRMRRMPAYVGTQAMIGAKAIARGDLDPEGFVFVRGERWKAVAVDGPIANGDRVEVTGVRGLTLTVRRSA